MMWHQVSINVMMWHQRYDVAPSEHQRSLRAFA